MPHLSKKNVTEKIRQELEEHLFKILMDTTHRERRKIFAELYTNTERAMFAKRLGMLALIDQGVPTHTISTLLKVSPSTVARFENKMEKSGYTETLGSLRRGKIDNQLLKFLADSLTLPFEGKRSSLKSLIERV